MFGIRLIKRLYFPLTRGFADYIPTEYVQDHIKYMRESMKRVGMIKKSLPEKQFNDAAESMYKRLCVSCKRLCEDYSNRGSFIENEKTKCIKITTKSMSVFEIWVDKGNQYLCVSSPITGKHQYWFEEQNETWLSNEDLHNMLEMLSRELMAIGPINI